MPSEFKKRKLIRSCLFCRKRKLKCDQQRPFCSSCKVRNQICTYFNPIESNNTSSLIIPQQTQLQQLSGEGKVNLSVTTETLLQEITNLQKQVLQLSNQINSIDNTPTYIDSTTKINIKKPTNPLYEFTYLHIKNSGSRILYGPTSMRAYVIKDRWGFGKKFHQLMIKYRSERHDEMYKRDDISLKILLEQLEYRDDSECNDLILEVCNELPTYEECYSMLNRFFDSKNNDIYPMNNILDRHRIIDEYFSKHFVNNSSSLCRNRSILILLSSENSDYYKIAVVLMIFCIVHYKNNIPKSILQFITRVTGLVGSKIYYIERLQFFALRCEYQLYINTDGDASNLINLINITSEIAVSMGLNRNIRQLYAGQENIVGTLDSLENLWLHILLLDLECSFHVGKPLCISFITLNESNIMEHDMYSRFKIKLIKFLKISRAMMSIITHPTGQPNLKEYCTELFNFIKNDLPPLQMFTEEEKFQHTQFRDVRLFSLALQMLLSFISLRFAVYNERSILLRDICIQTSLILLKMNVLLLKRCFELDEKYHPNDFFETETSLPPYMCLMLYTTNGLLPRVASVFCPLLYHKITRFDDDNLNKDTEKNNTDWDFSVLSITSEMRFSLIKAFYVYCELISHITEPVSFKLKKILERSHYIHVVLMIEKFYGTIIQKTLEFRSQIESCWMDKDIELVSLAHSKKIGSNTSREIDSPINSFEAEKFDTSEIARPSVDPIFKNDNNHKNNKNNHQNNNVLLSDISNKYGNGSTTVNIMEKYDTPEEYLQAMTDQFWNEFNINWSNDIWNNEAMDDILS